MTRTGYCILVGTGLLLMGTGLLLMGTGIQFCMQLTKAYVAERSCNQQLLIDDSSVVTT